MASGGVYALVSAAQRGLSFLLLPVYTAVLSPSEYGRLSVLLTIFGGTAVLFGGGLDYSVLRGYFERDDDPPSQQRFLISTWNFLFLAAPALAAVGAIVLLLAVPRGAVFRPLELALCLLAAAAFVCATTVPLTALRAEQRLRDYVILSAVSIATTAAFTVIAIVVLHLGPVGWVIAILMSSALSIGASMVILPWSRLGEFDRSGVRRALLDGLPLLPHALAQWSLQLADRLLLSGLVAPAALGVYSLGATLALPSMVFVLALNQGFMPAYARARNNLETARTLRATITLQITMVSLIGVATGLLGPPIAGIMFASSYAGAQAVIPWVALGYVFLGFYFIPMNAISLIAARTKFIWPITAGSACVNLACIYIFVPAHGIVAAAEASAVGYFVLVIGICLYAVRLRVPLEVDWRSVARIMTLSVLVYCIGSVVAPGAGLVSLFCRAALIATLVPVLAMAAGVSLKTASRQLRKVATRTR